MTIYHKQNPDIRVAKFGLFWFLQIKIHAQGQNKTNTLPHIDPWESEGLGHPSLPEAIALMYDRFPITALSVDPVRTASVE
jgi:hypothetical protein